MKKSRLKFPLWNSSNEKKLVEISYCGIQGEMISALNTCLVIHQRKAKVLKEAGLKSKQSQNEYLRLILHFTGKN